jgi:hypothetical protein
MRSLRSREFLKSPYGGDFHPLSLHPLNTNLREFKTDCGNRIVVN